MRRAAALALLCLASGASAASSPWSEKAYGVLLVGPDGGQDWNLFVAAVKKRLGAGVPVEAFAGPLETKSLQKALDRFQASRAPKVVIVPLFLHSASKEYDQLKYILGIEKLPSREFLDSWGMRSRVVPRAKTKAALVLGLPLGADEAVSDVLRERAKDGARRGPAETALLLGAGAGEEGENSARLKDIEAHAAKLEGAKAWLLRPGTKGMPRQGADSEHKLQELAQTMAHAGRVVVVPYLVVNDGSLRAWKKVLSNPFLRWVEKGLLPHERLVRWAGDRAEALRGVPDQVRFKDAGQTLPPVERGRGNPWGQNR